jgi:hypothetical protein
MHPAPARSRAATATNRAGVGLAFPIQRSHLCALLERDFEVAVVQDATAAATLPDVDGYLAAMTNCRYLANALWSTDEALTYM